MYADISIMANRCRFFFFLPCLALPLTLASLSFLSSDISMYSSNFSTKINRKNTRFTKESKRSGERERRKRTWSSQRGMGGWTTTTM